MIYHDLAVNCKLNTNNCLTTNQGCQFSAQSLLIKKKLTPNFCKHTFTWFTKLLFRRKIVVFLRLIIIKKNCSHFGINRITDVNNKRLFRQNPKIARNTRPSGRNYNYYTIST